MAYLVRRLLENTSNESWLKAGFMDNADVGSCSRPPPDRKAVDPGVERIARPTTPRFSIARATSRNFPTRCPRRR